MIGRGRVTMPRGPDHQVNFLHRQPNFFDHISSRQSRLLVTAAAFRLYICPILCKDANI
jgi:hypothetical protein